jgi:hypothetical protein
MEEMVASGQGTLVKISGTPQELLLEMEKQLQPFHRHVFTAEWHYQQYLELKNELATKPALDCGGLR